MICNGRTPPLPVPALSETRRGRKFLLRELLTTRFVGCFQNQAVRFACVGGRRSILLITLNNLAGTIRYSFFYCNSKCGSRRIPARLCKLTSIQRSIRCEPRHGSPNNVYSLKTPQILSGVNTKGRADGIVE